MKLKSTLVGVFAAVASLSFGQHNPTDNPDSTGVATESNVLFFAPNAFTPDGDFYNDEWGIEISGIDVYDFQLTIFNRAGQIVWVSYDPSAKWDGYFGGQEAPAGIYPWVIQTGDAVTDKVHQFTGMTNILR